MKTCYLYSLLAPVGEHFEDTRASPPPLVDIPIELKDGRQWGFAILGRPDKILAVRITIPEMEGPIIDPEDYKRYLKLRLFALDCIRINYDPTIEYFRQNDAVFSMHNFIEPEAGPNFQINIGQPLNPDYRVNAMGLKFLMAAPPDMRAIIHLLAEGNDYRLPIQFRFLSFYKIIELHYTITTNKVFNEFIQPFLPSFQELYPEASTIGKLCTALGKLRARCAHIELKSGERGFSHPEAELEEAAKAMPLITRIAIQCIRANYPDSPLRFSSSPEQSAADFEQMERDGLNPVKVSGS